MGFLFVFDRVDGKPIWPIEERAGAGERRAGRAGGALAAVSDASPKPFAKQGFGFNDLIDFTPELRARALEAIKDYRVGPLFTPPSLGGTIVMPGAIGGAGWGGGALDPRTGTIFIKATNQPALYKIVQPTRSDSLDADYTADLVGAGAARRDPAARQHAARAVAADQQAALRHAHRDRPQHRRHEVEASRSATRRPFATIRC